VIGNELGRLRNNVLNRRMFTTPQQRAALARGPVGINASGPELIRAAATAQGPDLGTRRGGVGTAGNLPNVIATNPGLAAANTDPSKRGDRRDRRSAITNPDDTTENQPPTITVTPQSSTLLPRPKPEPPASDNDKKTPKSEIDRFLEITGKRRGSTGKTRKENFADAKDFLAEIGITEAKDVRTDRDMLMMIGGLKLAMGYGTGSESQDAVKALNDVLGIYVGGKEAEREDQKAINLAAAKRAFDLEDAETARLAKLDEIELEAIAENIKQPEKLKLAKALMDEDPNLSLSDAMAEVNARSKSSSASLEILSTIKKDFPGIKGAFLRAINSAGGLRYVIENMTPEAIAANLGEDYSTPEGKAKVDAFMGLTAPPADVDGTPNDSTGGTGIIVTPVD